MALAGLSIANGCKDKVGLAWGGECWLGWGGWEVDPRCVSEIRSILPGGTDRVLIY